MSQRDRLLDQIRRVAVQGMGERRTDGQLLEHFINQRDEGAFALLLRRHGAMVWSVCRRVLGNPHDADDAFQAVFLVLVRKADSVRPREAVGNWLYGVAYRTALEARGRIARRRAKELSLHDMPPPQTKPDELRQELGPILDRELSRLADKYRLPIVLCDLEGRSRREVARQLAIPEGTLSSRLATARKKLAARLARFGFVVSGVALTALLADSTVTAGIAPSLFTTTTKAALMVAAGPAVAAGVVSATVSTLTEGVLKTMFIAKIKTTALVLCSVAALGIGTGGVYYQTRAGAADSPQVERVVQGNRKNAPEMEQQVIDKLKRENESLKNALESAQVNEERLRRKLLELEAVLAKMRAMQEDVALNARSRASNRKQDPNPALEKIDQSSDLLKKKYQDQFENLRLHLQSLDEQQQRLQAERKRIETGMKELDHGFQKQVSDLQDMKKKVLQEQAKQGENQQKSKRGAMRVDDDKLDQILQRLERLEQRLDRLEKSKR
jgi:RNA polymerase sigma factor (sigma-70 family)